MHHSSLITYHSSRTIDKARQVPLITYHLSLITCHLSFTLSVNVEHMAQKNVRHVSVCDQ